MRKIAALFLFLVFLAAFGRDASAQAQPQAQKEATVDLSEDFIPVAQDFDGARMTVFGALQSAKSDIVVVFKGPHATALVRAKVRQAGIWINGDPETIGPVASYYAVLSSRPLNAIAPPELWAKLGVGVETFGLSSPAGEGLIQDRIAKGLYVTRDDAVKIRDKKLFRADLQLPPNVPVGTYEAAVYEIQKGAVKASRTTSFKIGQVGIGGHVKKLAQESPILYAMLSIAFVLSLGGAGAFVFRRLS